MTGLWHHARTYPLAGAVVSLGAPSGFLLLRSFLEGRAPSPGWIQQEIASQPVPYAYMAISSLIVFTLLGHLIGRKEDALQAASATDPLTGLWNRRHLRARLHEELARASREGNPLALLLLDLDGLKGINDRNGHAAGDDALRRVAGCLRATCRAADITARHGGDEFAVIAPGTDAPHAMDLAERILTAVRHCDPKSRISVSIGVADLERAPSRSIDALYDAADRALYEAKDAGRDQARLAPLRRA